MSNAARNVSMAVSTDYPILQYVYNGNINMSFEGMTHQEKVRLTWFVNIAVVCIGFGIMLAVIRPVLPHAN